jgi:hypothetical protein
MSCDFNMIYQEIECKSETANSKGFFVLRLCLKDTRHRLVMLNISDKEKDIAEHDLILVRAGILPDMIKFGNHEICANHRDKLGMYK